MSLAAAPKPTEFEARLHRSRGRSPRAFSVSSRVTKEELRSLEATAASQGKAVGEWAREVLVAAAARTGPDVVLVELVATRLMVVNMLKMMSHNLPLTDPELAKITAQIQQSKRRVATELTEQMKRQNSSRED